LEASLAGALAGADPTSSLLCAPFAKENALVADVLLNAKLYQKLPPRAAASASVASPANKRLGRAKRVQTLPVVRLGHDIQPLNVWGR
jgi:hypothetical protein